MSQASATYYLWKWADNNLPGQPNEVFSELLHGKMHPAIQAFDAAPVVRQLERIAAQGRSTGEEWDWQIHQAPTGKEGGLHFLNLPSCARVQQDVHEVLSATLTGGHQWIRRRARSVD